MAAGVVPGESVARAPGADCYLLSRAGASALLAMLDRHGVVAGVDWMMLHAGLDPATEPGWPELTFLNAAARHERALTVLVAAAPAAMLSAEGVSAIDHKTTCAIDELVDHKPAQPLDGARAHALKFPDGDTRDPVFATLARGRLYEEPALDLMRRWMPEGGVFVDIGAHIGAYTCFMLAHGGAGRAIPLEFNASAATLLRQTAETNGLADRVLFDHLELGVAEERGKRERKGSNRNLARNRLRPGFVETVQVRTGDFLLKDEPVDLIKIDVCGDEREVLKGLRRTLRRKQPVVALDLSNRKGPKALPFLERMGYVEREAATWRDDEGERRFAIYTATRPPPALQADEAEA